MKMKKEITIEIETKEKREMFLLFEK